MTQFRERNPIPIGIAGIAVVLLLILALASFTNLPFLGGMRTIDAYFANASNLQKDDDVRIAGIKVGEVSGVKLAMFTENGVPTQVVEVSMKVNQDIKLADNSTADIKIKTLLGEEYVAITPGDPTQSTGALKGPIDATAAADTPLIVTQAFQQLATTVDSIDTNQLAQAFTVLSSDFANTPDEVSSTLKGLAAVSQTISSRDVALQQLLTNAQGVTTALASRDSEVTLLINDGQTVLNLVNQQRTVIHDLLLNTVTLSQQLSDLVNENQGILKPALDNVQATLAILTKDQTNLDDSIELLAPFIRDFANTLGNGQWFDNVVQNLSDAANGNCFSSSLTVDGTAVPAAPLPKNQGACS